MSQNRFVLRSEPITGRRRSAWPTRISAGAALQQDNGFANLTAAEALEISEVFQKQFETLLLTEKFPGRTRADVFRVGCGRRGVD